MVDFRIYRAGFFPALVAVVVLLFALQAPPTPLPSVVAPVEFNQASAVKFARQIIATAPDRTPGSRGDAATADMVVSQFRHVSEGQITEQRFSHGGSELRNVILTLPGQTPRSVVVMAPRDSAAGPGAASSAAATATLLELVNEMRLSRHAKTLVFVSTDGSSDGAIGAKEFADSYPQIDQVDGIVVISQPGSATPKQPSLIDSSDGAQSPSSQLVRTASGVLRDQTGLAPEGESVFGELSRLALPSGLGEQAPLIERGVPSVALSSAGERPLRVSQDQSNDLSPNTIGEFGRAALELSATIDGARAPLQHGPDAYLTMAGDLVPGWNLSLLAVTLLFPAALACVDAIARARRGGARFGWAFAWAGSRALPLAGALIALYLLALLGVVANPAFPFDPNSYGVGAGQVIAMLFLAGIAIGGYYLIRIWQVPSALPAAVAAPALGTATIGGVGIAWLANPYLGLLTVPAAHVWLLLARRRGPLPWPPVLLGAAIALLPLAGAVLHLAHVLDAGTATSWQLLLMIDNGQIGFGTMLAICLISGGLLGTLALAMRGPERSRPPRLTTLVEEETAPEPSRDGQTPAVLDASPIASSGADDDQEVGR